MPKTAQIITATVLVLALSALLLPAIYLGLMPTCGHPGLSEVGQLDAAMKQYKVLYRNYPPNFADDAAPQAHLQLAFKKNLDVAPVGLDAAEALVFWLQGYGDDSRHPLTAEPRRALMQFDTTRLRDADHDGFPEYYPPDCTTPYVYFHHDSYATDSFVFSPSTGVARAYRSDQADGEFLNSDTFQIICAGLDDHYGHGGWFPSGRSYSPQDEDNVANFSGGTLGSKRP